MANWGAIVGGVLAAGSTIYAANQQKKMQQEQYKQQQSLYNEQMQYQQNQINAARNTPIAQLAPIFMEQLINAYSGKLSKYGINFPIDEMMRIIGRGGGGGGGQAGGQGGGSGGGMQANVMPSVDNVYGVPGKGALRDGDELSSRQFARATGAQGFGAGTGRLRQLVDFSNSAAADAIWNQETGQGMLAMGGGGGGAPNGNIGMSDQGYLMSVPNQGGVEIKAKDPWYTRLGDTLRNVGNWYDSLDESGGGGLAGFAQNRAGDALQSMLMNPLGLAGVGVNWWLNSDPAALQLENYGNPMNASSSILSDPNNRAFIDAYLGPLMGGQSFASGYDPRIFGY